MERVIDIYFSKKPSYEVIILKIKEYSGLDFEIEKDNYFLGLFPKEKLEGLDSINFYNDEREKFNNKNSDIEYLIFGSSSSYMSYIEGVALRVLKELGGKYENHKEIEIPLWTKEKWQGASWWKKVGTKEGWLWKLIKKYIL